MRSPRHFGPTATLALALALDLAGSSWSARTAHALDLEEHEIRAVRTDVPPRIDGVLDDEVWAGAPLALGPWISYNPLRGEPARQETSVWVAYDERALYFAFRCFDPEPGRLRATVTRRDNAWNDDWIAVSLDSMGTGQTAYHMFVNPLGIQMDALNTVAIDEDPAVDWAWQSAGRIDEQGYTVEIRLPLESIRFPGGTDVRMGLLFFRRNSRLGISWSWPEMPPGQWVFQSHAPLILADLRQPRILELIPSAVVSSHQSRNPGQSWPSPTSTGQLGASVKYGLTSTLTLDATVNPDFSQVESDALQVEVNQRVPVFLSEKRPFFMEGLGLFTLAGTGGDATMRTSVHTRRIVEPSAGARLTGTAGAQTLALLSAADRASGPHEHQRKFTIGRIIRNVGEGEYVGGLVTSVEQGRAHNRVAAADVSLRHGSRFRWNGAILYAHSASPAGDAGSGMGGQATYAYSTRRWSVMGQAEHYDRDFRMDTAFLQRVGVTRGWQYQEVQFHPDEARYGWLKRVAPFLWTTAARDHREDGREHFLLPGLRLNFTRQGYLRIDYGRGRETFSGHRFIVGRTRVEGGAQLLRWLHLNGAFEAGPGIFYDPVSPFQGTSRQGRLRVDLQPTAKLNQQIAYHFAGFAQAPRATVFAVHLLDARTTYQFSPRLLVRAIGQFDSGHRRILGDLLVSYELVPGTAVHAGYGTLAERQGNGSPYAATTRAFFFKASYLARFCAAPVR